MNTQPVKAAPITGEAYIEEHIETPLTARVECLTRKTFPIRLSGEIIRACDASSEYS